MLMHTQLYILYKAARSTGHLAIVVPFVILQIRSSAKVLKSCYGCVVGEAQVQSDMFSMTSAQEH